MFRFMQYSLNGGEWSKLLEGRVDLEKYGNALYRLENFVIDPRGPVRFRPGFRYIAGTKTNGSVSRLIPFEYSSVQAYILEFGDQYIRFYRDQAPILSGGVPYEVVSPYAAADLADLCFYQSADVLYLLHENYAPRKLSRTGHTSWFLQTINFKPPALKELGVEPVISLSLGATTGTGVTFTSVGASVFYSGDVGRIITSGVGRASITTYVDGAHVICDIIDDFTTTGPILPGSWSMLGSPGGALTPSINGPVGAICKLTCTSGTESRTNQLDADPASNDWGLSAFGTDTYYLKNTASYFGATSPDKFYIDGVEAVKGPLPHTLGIRQWAWGNVDTLGYNTIYLRLADGSDPDTLSGVEPNTYLQRAQTIITAAVFRPEDVGKYVRINNGLIHITSWVGIAEVYGEVLKELDSEVKDVPDESRSWTLESDVWNATYGYPSVGTFYEERNVMASTTEYPETIWGSVVGDYENFTPGTDDADAYEFTLAGRQVNKIQWIEPREYLVAGTLGGEWRVGPEDTGSPLTPLNVVAKEEQKYGSAKVMPETIGGATLFVQRAGRKIREFTYQWESDGYSAPDMTVLAEHMTKGGIAGMAYQKEPYSVLWVWMTDGSLAGLTYMREENVIGWHRHPMDGEIESMAVIPGDGYDEVWAVVRRTVNGSTVRYVEMMEAFFDDTAEDYTDNKGLNAFFVDCGITYNGASTTTITGLSHLEGESVVALANGGYVSPRTVSGGSITLSAAATVVHVGLPYTGLLQTMRPDANLRDGTAQAREKKIHEVNIRVHNSGPLKAGRDESHLDVVVNREQAVVLGAPYSLFTGDLPIGYDDSWNKDARIMLVQDRPMPLTVVAIIPEVSIA